MKSVSRVGPWDEEVVPRDRGELTCHLGDRHGNGHGRDHSSRGELWRTRPQSCKYRFEVEEMWWHGKSRGKTFLERRKITYFSPRKLRPLSSYTASSASYTFQAYREPTELRSLTLHVRKRRHVMIPKLRRPTLIFSYSMNPKPCPDINLTSVRRPNLPKWSSMSSRRASWGRRPR